MEARLDTNKGIIAWFARNPVAANLLMAAIIIGGLYSAINIRKQMFPQSENTWITVNIAYRGASPKEVEEAITVKLEEALFSVQGLERVITTSNRGNANARIKVLDSYKPQEVLDEVKSAIDSISSFPEGMERPVVQHQRHRQEVMYISLIGDVAWRELRELGEHIYDEIRSLEQVNITEYYRGLNYEIAIEISSDKLREYNIGFNDVANAVRGFSTNQSAGQIRADEGFISVRVEQQGYVAADFENIPIRTLSDGTQLRVGDVANVLDGFEEGIQYSKVNGKNSVVFFVGASNDQSITDVSAVLNTYIAERSKTLPEAVSLSSWVDFTYYLEGRLNMMLSNMFYGGILVFIILSLFLRMRLAFWVMMGLPISFLGAMSVLPLEWVGVTVNVVSLFAFIMVLGVVVDDAIIIGESVHSEVEREGLNINNVIRGAKRVATPATFGVLTTMAAFAPMAIQTGPNSAMPHAIGYVVILCLLFSLVESKLILPAHLASMKPEKPNPRDWLSRARRFIDRKQSSFISHRYTPFLSTALKYRYTTLAFFIGLLILTGALFASGNIRFLGMPKIPHDYSRIMVEMNADASEQKTLEAVLALEAMIWQAEKVIEQEHGKVMVDKVQVNLQTRTTAEISAKLVDPEFRPMDTFELSNYWRRLSPEIPGLKQMRIVDSLFGGRTNDGDLSFRIKSKDESQLKQATQTIKDALAEFEGVSDIGDSEKQPTTEIQFILKPKAYALSLTTAEIARQTSYALFGIEAQRIVRDRQELRVMVRYPKNERHSLNSVQHVMIRSSNGAEIPLSELAELEFVESQDQIYREEGNRAITVWATVDFKVTQPIKVANYMRENVFPQISGLYPRVQIEESGKLKEEREDLHAQILSILVILLPIYVLLALPLRSYTQPIMIMSIIPFGIIGAIYGHFLLGMDLSRMSMFGIFAVVGVVVNDSLVMVDFINAAKKRGDQILHAVIDAGAKRFRAIILTSLTTFIGLVPIMSETSLQAKIVIPMAVSLAFGVLFATIVTLILVPCLYIIMNDLKNAKQRTKNGVKALFQSRAQGKPLVDD